MVQSTAPFSTTQIGPHVPANERTKFRLKFEPVEQLHGGRLLAIPILVVVRQWLSAVEPFKDFANDDIELDLAHASLLFENVHLNDIVVESRAFVGCQVSVQLSIPWEQAHDKILQRTHACLAVLHIEILLAVCVMMLCQRDLANWIVGHD